MRVSDTVKACALAALEQLGADGWPVSVEEVVTHCEFGSKATAWRALHVLISEGRVERNPRGRNGYRAIRVN